MIAVARKAVAGRASMAVTTWHISSILVTLAIHAIRATSDTIDTRSSLREDHPFLLPVSTFCPRNHDARFWKAPLQIKLRENDTCHVASRSAQIARHVRGEIISTISNLFAEQTVYVRDVEGRFRERFRDE